MLEYTLPIYLNILAFIIILILIKLMMTMKKRGKKTEVRVTEKKLNLTAITKQAVNETDIDDFIEKIIPELVTSLKVDYIQILELLPNQCVLFLKAGYGWKSGLVGAATVSASVNNLFGYTLAQPEPVIFRDLPIETRFRGGPLLDNHYIISGITVTISKDAHKYGLLGVYSQENRNFNQEEIDYLLSISHLLTFVFNNQQQQENLALFKRAVDASSNGITITDALELENPIIYVNKSFTEITGYPSEEVIGKNCRFLQQGDNQQPELTAIRKAIIEEKECHQILRNYRKDGTLFWNELSIIPIRDRHGCLTHFLGIQNDITSKKMATEKLQASESRFRAIFEQAAVGIAQISLDGTFLRVNEKASQIWGYTPTELLNINFKHITHPDDLEISEHLYQQLLNNQLPTFTQEKRYLHQDGSIVWGQVTVSLVKEAQEQDSYFIAVIIDITQRKQLETELENFNRSLKYLHKASTQPHYDFKILLFNYLETGCHILRLSTGIITEVNQGYYKINTVYSNNLQLNTSIIVPVEDTFCNQVKEKEQTISYNQIGNNPELNQHQAYQKWKLENYIGTPIWVNGKIYGILSFWSNKMRADNFSPNECQIVELMAESIGKLLHSQEVEKVKLANEKRFNSILGSLKDGVWSIDIKNHQVLYINSTLGDIYGYSVNQFIENRNLWLDLIYPEDAEKVKKVSGEFLRKRTSKDLEYRIIRSDGEIIWIRDRAQFIYDSLGNPLRIDGIVTDITDRKQIEEQLRQERDLLNGITQTSVAAIMVLGLQGKIIFANVRAEEILAIAKEDLLASYYNPDTWKIKDFDGNPLSEEELPFSMVMRTQKPVFEVLHTIEWPDYTVRFLSVNGAPLQNETGEIRGVVICINDITEQQTLEKRLIYNAYYDSLTKLPNRVLFTELLHDSLEQSKLNPDYLFAVLFLDLDRFKDVNDGYGHQIGDRLLISFAQRVKNCLRQNDILVRLSGDEFAILLDHLNHQEDAIAIAKRIQHRLQKPFNINGQEIFTGVSIGITFSSIGYESATDLLRDADLSMYKVKENGRGGYQVFIPTMHDELLNRVRLETELRKAIEKNELCLYYQPILSLATETLVGFEALVRWYHPQYGLTSPADFIPVAEETGLIVNIGEWILREACLQLQIWQKKYPAAESLTMSVNVSGRQLKEANLVANIETILQDTQIEHHLLKLEITETVLMENESSSITMLENLKNKGISLCLDDFGTGYSSLSYLHDFPINILKVDQSFVRRIDEQSDKIAIIKGIIALAHSLNIKVIAEGIETRKQYSFLKSCGCEYGQGYLFSRPLEAAIVESRIQQEGWVWI